MPLTFSFDSPPRIPLAIFFLRLGFIFVFSYTAYEGMLDPAKFAKWIYPAIAEITGVYLDVLLYLFFISEICLILWLMSGKRTDLASLIIVFLLAGITLTNMDKFDVAFRNIGLICSALALLFLEREHSDRSDMSF